MNNVILIGRLAKDPELRATENTSILNFILAVNRDYKNAEGKYDADFISCKTFGVMAQNGLLYLKKGSMIGIRGRIQTSKYTTKDGITRYITEVVADKITYLSKNENTNNNVKQEEIRQENVQKFDPYKDFGIELEIDNTELPFDFKN